MKKAGAEIIDPADLPSQGQMGNAEFEVLCYEFKAGLNAYLGKLGPGAKDSLAGRCHRFQRAASRPGNALLRPGGL
jgi:hypothetical protein